MKIRTRAVWLPAVTLLATSCITGAVLSLNDSARATIQTARPGAWMASEQAGSVSHLGPDGVDATVELAHSAGDLHIVQVDGVAYVSDSDGRLSRIDPAQLEVAQEAMLPSSTAKLVAGGGKLYAVDADTGVVRQLDPVQLTSIGQPVNVGAKLGAAVVDDNGVLWVTDLSTGKVVAVDGQTVGTAHQVAQPGVDVRLSVVGDDVVAVNPSTATATVVSGSTPSSPHPVPADTGGVLDVPENVEQGSVLPIVTGPHTLTLLQVRSGEARKVELPVSGHTFGTPKVSGERVYLADFTNGSLIVIDITRATVVNTVKITGKPGPFEVLVDGSTVYVNDPTSEHAWTIGASGEAVPADKYDPNSPRGGGAVQAVVPPAPSLPTLPPPPADDGNGGDEPTTTTTTVPASTTSTTVRSRDDHDHDRDRTSTTTERHDGDHAPGTTPASPGRGHTTTTASTDGNGNGSGSTVATIVVGPGSGTGVTAPGTTTTTVPTGDGAVGAVVAVAGDGAATVTWTAPGGWNTITGYTIVVKASGGGAPAPTTLQIDAAATGFTVRPLENGRAYSFDVTAQSAQGPGRTVASNRVVPTKNAPKAPTNVGVTPGDAQVVVTWQAPTGPPVDGYVVDIVDGRGATVATLPLGASATTATLQGLPNGVELRAAVHATVDANGTTVAGAVATSSPFMTKGKPFPPGSVIATVTGAGRVRVSWTAAADNGSPITGYTVTAASPVPADIVFPQPITQAAPPDARQVEIGLPVAHSFAITVTAANAFGATDSTDVVRVLVETTNGPAAPTNVTATAGYHAATITWDIPQGNGTGIADYIVRNLNDGTTRSAAYGHEQLVWDGLTPGVSYTFDVRANGTNHVLGLSGMSPAVVAAGTTPVGAVVASLAADTVVNLAVPPVAPPLPGFPAITSWEVTTVPDSGLRSFPTTTPLLVVDSLALGTGYTFNVVAVDAAGGRSAPSTATVTTGSGAPPTPTGFSAMVRTANSKTGSVRITFTWNAVPGATSYTLDRGTGGAPVVLTTTTYAFTIFGDDVDYTATLTATNGFGTSAAASRTYYVPYVAGTCPGCIPP